MWECVYCNYIWQPRLNRPNRCPNCFKWLPLCGDEDYLKWEGKVVVYVIGILNYGEPRYAKQISHKLRELNVNISAKQIGGILRRYPEHFQAVEKSGGKHKWIVLQG